MNGKTLAGLVVLCGLLALPSGVMAAIAPKSDTSGMRITIFAADAAEEEGNPWRELKPDSDKAPANSTTAGTKPIPAAQPAGKPNPFIDDPVMSMALIRMNRIPCSRVVKLTREARLVVLGWIDGYVSGRAALDPKLRDCVDKKTGSVSLHGLALRSQDENLKNYCAKNPTKTIMDFINDKQEVISDDILDEPTMPENPDHPDFENDK